MTPNEKDIPFLISVVIPVLNNKQQFSNCLDSVLVCESHQTIDLEIIIIDGGSDDGTLDMIDSYKQYVSYWETGQDSGIADAFNRGIAKSTGDVIAILNSDDFWHNDTLKHIERVYKGSPTAEVFYGDLEFFDEDSGKKYIKKPDISKMKYRMNIFHPTMFVKRSAYEKVGLYDLAYQYAMDSEWCHRALADGLKFEYIPHVLATMRTGGISDREFKFSLREYRESVVQHRLVTPWKALVFYYYFYLMKLLMKVSWLKELKHKIMDDR